MTEKQSKSFFDFIILLFRYVSQKINFQHFLYLLVFITFDIGDAATASFMMDLKGISAEYNIIVQYIYFDYGLSGLISAKLLFIIIPLKLASTIVKRSYWMINGILIALIMLGILAIQANLRSISGLPHMSPNEINMIYLMVLFILSIGGTIMDDYISKIQREKSFFKS